MKKIYSFLTILIPVLAACSSEDTISYNNQDDINFRAHVSHNNTSRGLEISNQTLDKFFITAVEKLTSENNVVTYTTLFENTLFQKEGDVYVSDPPFQWSKKMVLNFYAYGYRTNGDFIKPGDAGSLFGTGVTFNGQQQTINNFSPQADISQQIDLIGACALDQGYKGGMTNTVGLNFAHLLSEVQVVARCSSPTYRVYIKAIKYGNIKCKGTYSFGSNSWTLLPENAESDESPLATTSYGVSYKAIDLSSGTPDHYSHQGTNDYHDISKSENTVDDTFIGYAMLLPQSLGAFEVGKEYWAPGGAEADISGKTLATAQYMAMLIKIMALDNGEETEEVKFPKTEAHKADSDGYGWAYIPIRTPKVSQWQAGTRYVYHLDFSDGAGYNQDGNLILEGVLKLDATVDQWKSYDDLYPNDGTDKNK